ncbi:hypothetical protein PTTG_03283 [Puccinia triticina 1-1 BBBD Race 1]|uniref:Uncharacterized protein n=1 Tax=Puccinia triticina (isolate 1-1 / race 1 (BBBD)) TaxID=630390 RepID=A0A180GBR7_PUCT1|nr:hypothetical protein PTTG_03283 [Puccinia triticina 1-1 BBBD Race 1]
MGYLKSLLHPLENLTASTANFLIPFLSRLSSKAPSGSRCLKHLHFLSSRRVPRRNRKDIYKTYHLNLTSLSRIFCLIYSRNILLIPTLKNPFISSLKHLVNLQENAELIAYYLRYLRLRKEERDRNYVPTPWETLTREEQIQLAVYHAHIHEQEDIQARLEINALVREHRAYHKEQRRLRKLKAMASDTKSAQTIVGDLNASTNTLAPASENSNTTGPLAEKPAETLNSPTNPSSKDSSLTQLELEERQLQERIKKMKFTPLTRKEGPAPIPEKDTSKEMAMDLDPAPSASSAVTPARPIIPAIPARHSTPKISELLEKEQTKLRVKKHVDIWKECLKEALLGATPKLRSLLTKAQESQKALQKLIPNDEIEDFVKGWNSWTEKKKFFPAPPKTDKGKRRSSTSINFENPHKWRKIGNMLKIAEGLYKNMD